MNAGCSLLVNTRVSAIIGSKLNQELISITDTVSVEEALQVMSMNNISSVPIFSSTSNSLLGLLDIYEIMSFLVFSDRSELNYQRPAADLLGTMGNEIDDAVCGVWSIHEDESIARPLEYLSKGVHRFLIETSCGIKVLSQLDLVKFLFKSFDKFDLDDVTLKSGEKIVGVKTKGREVILGYSDLQRKFNSHWGDPGWTSHRGRRGLQKGSYKRETCYCNYSW
eukprot:TRINITY_DN7950_c0_g1_i2.p1 TRINITY_DN7950_c0_g1~~TRINITY_DN7950_c0_g1_i2.p1  ORF type:complete len:223 (+),score=20.51 TRINITY_DN7950_c0_g1_i2:307-975(+)